MVLVSFRITEYRKKLIPWKDNSCFYARNDSARVFPTVPLTGRSTDQMRVSDAEIIAQSMNNIASVWRRKSSYQYCSGTSCRLLGWQTKNGFAAGRRNFEPRRAISWNCTQSFDCNSIWSKWPKAMRGCMPGGKVGFLHWDHVLLRKMILPNSEGMAGMELLTLVAGPCKGANVQWL